MNILLLEISIPHLRDLIKNSIINNQVHIFLPTKFSDTNVHFPNGDMYYRVPANAYTIANYNYLYRLAETAGYLTFNKSRYNSMASAANNIGLIETTYSLEDPLLGDSLPLILNLILRDMSKYNAFVCSVAWLTNDNFRWHTINERIEEGVLSYDLVSSYIDFIIPFCCVLANVRREYYIQDLTPEILERIETQAILDTAKYSHSVKGVAQFLKEFPVPQ